MVSSEDVSVVDSLPPTDVPIDSEVVMTGLPGHVNPEAELYDSSPSPGSYYDTASESAPFPTTDNSQSTDYFISVSSDDKLHDLEQVIYIVTHHKSVSPNTYCLTCTRIWQHSTARPIWDPAVWNRLGHLNKTALAR